MRKTTQDKKERTIGITINVGLSKLSIKSNHLTKAQYLTSISISAISSVLLYLYC
jgi:hypothetical protein